MRNILLSVLCFLLTSCGKEEEVPVVLEPVQLLATGSYKSGCIGVRYGSLENDYILTKKSSLTLGESSLLERDDYYASPNCGGDRISFLERQGFYTLDSAQPYITKFYNKVEGEAFTSEGNDLMNEEGICVADAFSSLDVLQDFSSDVECGLGSFANPHFDLYEISGSSVTFGNSSTGNGSSPDSRPTEVLSLGSENIAVFSK